MLKIVEQMSFSNLSTSNSAETLHDRQIGNIQRDAVLGFKVQFRVCNVNAFVLIDDNRKERIGYAGWL